MAYEHKDMSGSLFKNDRREKDTHPNLTGSCVIDGVEYWLNGWTKEHDQRGRWISLSFRRKEQPKEPERDTRTHSQRKRSHDDDPPF